MFLRLNEITNEKHLAHYLKHTKPWIAADIIVILSISVNFMKGMVVVGELSFTVFPTQPAASLLCAMAYKSKQITDGLEQAILSAWEII